MSGLCNCFLPSGQRGFKAVLLAASTVLIGTSGCQSVPRLYSPSGAAWNVASARTLTGKSETPQLTAAPDFDLPSETNTATTATAPAFASSPPAVSPAAGANGTKEQAIAVPAAAERAGSTAHEVPAVAAQPGKNAVEAPVAGRGPVERPASAAASLSSPRSDAANSADGPPKAAPAVAQMAKADDASVVDAGAVRVTPQKPAAGEGRTNAATTTSPAAPAPLPTYSERRPETFAWRRTGKSAGARPFEISLTGENGFRTLFIGSAAGNDPIAMKLMEKLARHLHENGLILGGFEAAVIHTLNPDGAASGQPVNALGRYVNGRFPPQPDQKPTASTPEVDFLLNCIRSFRPQRIVHVRTLGDSSGVIASNERCAETAQLIAESLKFSRLSFPAQSREGSLEHCLSSQEELDVITLAIPRGVQADGDPWALYGDTLLNLLQPRNEGGREASRSLPENKAKSP